MTTIICDGCGRELEAARSKLVTRTPDGRILVRPYCDEGSCSDARVKEFVDARKCVWCGSHAQPGTWKLGGLGEPYCGEACYNKAGKAMFGYDLRSGL